MSELLTVDGTIEKQSDSRGSWGPLTLDVSEELDGDACSTVSIAAAATLAVSLQGMTSADFVVIKTPREVLVTATIAGATITAMPVRSLLVWSTRDLTALSINNAGTEAVLVSIVLAEMTD